MRKPRVRVLYDGHGWCYCGRFTGGYSAIGAVATWTLAEAIEFYFRVLRSEQTVESLPDGDPHQEEPQRSPA